MKTTKSTSHTTDILSLQDFCKASKKIYGVKMSKINTLMGDPDGWSKLADLWEEHSKGLNESPFHKAVSYIKYAYDLKSCSPLDKALSIAVCRELCSDGPAGYAWRNHPLFKRALDEAEPEDDHVYHLRLFSGSAGRVSYQHCHYLEQRMMQRYCAAQGVNNSTYDSASSFIAGYEEFISNLCPAASCWESDHWIDLDHILDALQSTCECNYRITHREYDILISAFRMGTSTYSITRDREHDYLRCIFNLEHFSMRWAQAMWPIDTENSILKMYLLAKNFVDNDCAFEDITRPCHIYDVDDHIFTHSWIYSVVQKWINSGDLHTRYESDYKKAMFEVSLNI